MRVTHIITRLIVGGAQENTVASVLGLRRKPGLQVELVSGPSLGPEGSLEHLFAGMTESFTTIPELVRPVNPWKDAVALRKLTRHLRARRPDIVHTHSGKAGVLGRIAAARARIPIIIHHVHGPSFGPFQPAPANFIFRNAERYAARMTTHFICSAHAMTRLYVAAGIGRPEQYTRILSGFNLKPYEQVSHDAALRRKLGLLDGDFVIGKIARLAPLKGHDDLFAALKRLLPKCPQARLLLLGGGVLRDALEAKARAMGLANKVILTGLLPPKEVPRHIGIMDCLAHLSTREALSRALPQALAAGRPVVAYDFDGADEICLEDQTGFLVRTGDVSTVSDRLLELFLKPDLRERFGRRGREFVFEHFSVERLVDAQYELYQRLAIRRGLRADTIEHGPHS
jgi:glycosyltransferase involved in cell wall biosynthesis